MEHEVHIPENRNLFILKNIYRPNIKKYKNVAAYLKPAYTHTHMIKTFP